MDLLERTKEICKLHSIYPSRSKGQNFLIEENVYDKIIAAADLKKIDAVLEVGPGLGFLTAKLAAAAGKVLAVELDDKLAAYLRADLSGKFENVEILNENVLDLRLPSPLLPADYKIVANLPYNITSVFIRKFLTAEHQPREMILMLQKEVAERICAKPGKMSLLALSVQFYAEPEIIAYVPKENFWPMPQVGSAIIKIKIKNSPLERGGRPLAGLKNSPLERGGRPLAGRGVLKSDNQESRKLASLGIYNDKEKDFFRLAKIGFSAKRKMLKNNLANGLHVASAEMEKMLIEAGFNPKIRAEDLGVEDWKKLATHNT
jgi:16S rRNA (adenine1518-N6/adenine1519-N6)-dimethyltransferase